MKKIGIIGIISAFILAAFQPGAETTEALEPFGIGGVAYSHAKASGSKTVFKDAEAHLTLFNTTGAKWARQDFWWGLIEPEKGKWEWEYFDKAMESYKRHDLNLLAILCYGSAWYTDAPVTRSERKLFGRYVYNMVKRYKDTCKYWEIWNEPNILPFWSPKPRAEDYAALLKVAYKQAKKADPECIVVGGVFAGPDSRFLDEMYQHGVKGYFDILSFHTYGQDPREDIRIQGVEDLRNVMKKYDDEKPIWCTETGVFTGAGGADQETQAKLVVKSTITLLSADVEKVFQLSLRNWTKEEDAVDHSARYGLYLVDGTPKKAAIAFKTMVRELTGARYIGRADIVEGVRGHLFEKDGEQVLVLWSLKDKVNAQVNLGSREIQTITLMGETKPMMSANMRYLVSISTLPMYIKGVGKNVTLASQMTLASTSKQIRAGASDALMLFVKNPTDSGIQGTVTVRPPAGVEITETKKKVSIKAGESDVVTFPLKTSDDITLGKHDVRVTFVTNNPDIGYFSVFKTIEVTQPISIEIQKIQNLQFPNDALKLTVKNLRNDNITGQVKLATNAPAKVRSFEVSLDANESKTLDVELETSKLKPAVEYSFEASFTHGNTKVTDSYKKAFLFVPRVKGKVKIDADLSEWEKMKPNITPDMLTEVDFNTKYNEGTKDLSARGWLAYDDNNLYLVLDVTDDAISLPTGVTIWDNDSLQMAIDGLHDANEKDTFDHDNDFQIEAALWRDGKLFVTAGQYPAGRIESVVEEETKLAIKKVSENRMIYEIAFPEGIFLPLKLEEGKVFGFSFILNDNDGIAREGWFELTPGIGWGKEPHYYNAAVLMPE
jgi:hypothetical protein